MRKLARVRYCKYTLEGEEVYIKEKAYLHGKDGWIETQEIQKRTYKTAKKRGDTCIDIAIEENIGEIPISYIAKVYSSIYKINRPKMYKNIENTMKKIKELKKESQIGPMAEYKIFKKLLEKEMNGRKL